jgi:hypothetical protein
MDTKVVYQLDSKGIYLGEEVARRSPLDKEVVWLIPAGCVEIAPPKFDPTKKYARWCYSELESVSGWELFDIPIPTPEEVEHKRVLTEEELLIQKEEELIQSEIRKIAIGRLGNKLTIVKE